MTRRGRGVCSAGRSVSLVNRIVQLTSYPETIEEEGSEAGSPCEEEEPAGQTDPDGKPSAGGLELPAGSGEEKPPPEGAAVAPAPKSEEKDAAEIRKRRRLEQAGIKVMPAAQRFARLALRAKGWPGWLCACLLGWNLSGVWEFPSFLLFVAPLFRLGATGNPSWSLPSGRLRLSSW